MIDHIRLLPRPSCEADYPTYLRNIHGYQFFKVLSNQKIVWVKVERTEHGERYETGWKLLTDEYFDLQFLVNFLCRSSEAEYVAKLTEVVKYHDRVRVNLNI